MGGPSNNLVLIESPAETPMAFIIADSQGVGDSNDHTHSMVGVHGRQLFVTYRRGVFGGGNSPMQALGSSNYLFADGHVGQVDAAFMKARIDSGDNFAKPR